MDQEYKIALMAFGGVVAIAGIALSFTQRNEPSKVKEGDDKNRNRNAIEFLGLKLEMATSGSIIFLAGCVIFMMPFIVEYIIGNEANNPPPKTEKPVPPTVKPERKKLTLPRFFEPLSSTHDIKLLSLKATTKEKTQVGDTINVKFVLQNIGDQPIHFLETFVALRSPLQLNKDFGTSHHNEILEVGERFLIDKTFRFNDAGRWVVWPCYELQQDTNSTDHLYCPDEWSSFAVDVVETD